MLTRRQFVAATAGSWICAGLPKAFAKGAHHRGPRYFVTLFLRGGIDPVYTMDPKLKSEVEPRVDVPYDGNAIVDAGAMQLGPHFKALKKWSSKMAIVRAVQVKTANHESGAFQTIRMRTGVTTNMPSLYDIIGSSRDGQPLASVLLGEISSFEHSPGALAAPTGAPDGKTSLDLLDGLDDEDIAILAKVFQGHLDRVPKWQASPEAEQTREYMAQTAAFFERMKHIKRFKPADWVDKNGKAKRAGEDLQRTLWFLENDLARGVCVKIFFDWDSHYRNADKQAQSTGDFTNILSKFLEELHERHNEHGTLSEQTLVVIGSELGRYPVLNGNLGKDHWPEAPYIFVGPNVKQGNVYVPTGKFMEGLPISLDTGHAGDTSATHVVLDDVGTTMLHMAGMDPSLYGYQGRRLKFLERA
jgi:uncharacterized protein (DUF1501 family)